jgi:soluble lytic murein transglycosylase-like protein
MPPQPRLQVVVRLREIVSRPGIRAKTQGMRFARSLLAVTSFLLLAAAAPAGAAVSHTVQPGETLWSIAAANNLTTRTVAAFNGLPETAQVVLGSTVNVPTTVEGAAALQAQGIELEGVAPQAAAPAATTAAAPAQGAPAVLGSYVVRAGDTLSGLAANAGVATSQMAAANGIDPSAPLLTGTVLKLPSGAPAPARASEPLPVQRVVPAAGPEPTSTRLGAADIQSVASQHGVSPSLAAAIAWQESGFNNGMVSSANARGVMQVMPGTWDYVETNLAGRQLDAGSATDNVHAGVLYLKHLLEQTGGDENTAIAGYYQGLGAVRSRGLFDDTEQYVANVQALRSRFGG